MVLQYLWNALHEVAQEYYPIVRLWVGPSAMVFICHPDDLEILLRCKTNIDKGSIYNYVKPLLQDGLVMSKGNKWQCRRKLLAPAVNINNLRRYVDITAEHGNNLVAYIKSYGDESAHSLFPLTSSVLLNVFCEAAMGVRPDKIGTDIMEKYKEALKDIFNINIYRVSRPYIRDWMIPFMKLGRMQKQCIKDLHDLRDKLIQERKEYYELTKTKSFEEISSYEDAANAIGGDNVDKKNLPFIDLLLAAEKEGLIDQQGIEEEVDVFLIGGHETVATAMVYLLMLLAENEEAQELARREVFEVFDQTGGKITLTDLANLNYLDRCVKEALRLYPSVPFFLRHIKEDIQLKNYLIPAGTDVMCMIYGIHRDPNFWPNPSKFDPDRFLPDNVKNRHPYAYLPFSAGPRNCIGYKVGMLQLKTLGAYILYNFYLKPVDATANLKFLANFSLHPTTPVHVKFVKINK